MRIRLLSGTFIVVLLLVAGIVGGWPWRVLVATIALLAVNEAYQIENVAGRRPARSIGWLLAPTLVLSAAAPELNLASAAITAATIAAFVWQIGRSATQRSTIDLMATLAYPVYLGTLLGYLVALREFDGLGLGADSAWSAAADSSPAWLLLLLCMVWLNDSGAYLGGRLFGHRPFFPSISPKKTWEGALSGAIVCIAFGFAAPGIGSRFPEIFGPLATEAPWAVALLGLLVSLVAPAGDLAESVLKRQAGVKDSGSLIPGHGGILDRFDSLMFAAPVVYLVARWMGG